MARPRNDEKAAGGKSSKVPDGPFFLKNLSSKVRVSVSMEGPVEAEMKAYLKFCTAHSGMDYETVENMFVSTVIREAIRKDKFYQAMKKTSAKGEAGSEG